MVAAGIAGDQAAELVAAIAIVTGLLFLALALLRMGWISRFLSKAVVTGFLAGAAVDVVVGELSKLTGTAQVAKVGIVDDRWLTLGSANLNAHSFFNHSEVNLITCDAPLARDTRLRLWAAHI
jgi:MFS superfamily sulfate permease-like transporter